MRTITVEKIDGEYKVNTKARAGSNTAYAWVEGGRVIYTNFDIAPETATNELALGEWEGNLSIQELMHDPVGYGVEYEKISDTSFRLTNEAESNTYTRDNTLDFKLWELSN